MKKSLTWLLALLGIALLATTTRYFYPKSDQQTPLPPPALQDEISPVTTGKEEREIIETLMDDTLTTLTDWKFVEPQPPTPNPTEICMEEKVALSGEYQGYYWGECRKEHVEKSTISREQACSLPNGKYTKEMLPVEIEGVHTLSEGFYKRDQQIYYITNTSKESEIPSVESNDREMYLMHYDCDTQSNTTLHTFNLGVVGPLYTIEYVRNTGLTDKFLLKDHPYERHSPTPFEGYSITSTVDNYLTDIYVFHTNSDYYRNYFKSEWLRSNNALIAPPQVMNQLEEEVLQKCDISEREKDAEDDRCISRYSVEEITDTEIVFTVTTLIDEAPRNQYQKTYKITY